MAGDGRKRGARTPTGTGRGGAKEARAKAAIASGVAESFSGEREAEEWQQWEGNLEQRGGQ